MSGERQTIRCIEVDFNRPRLFDAVTEDWAKSFAVGDVILAVSVDSVGHLTDWAAAVWCRVTRVEKSKYSGDAWIVEAEELGQDTVSTGVVVKAGDQP